MESTKTSINGYHLRRSEKIHFEPETRENSSPLLQEKHTKASKLSIKSGLFHYSNDATLKPTAEESSVESSTSQQPADASSGQAVLERAQKSKKINPRCEIERKKKTELCRNWMRTGTCKYLNEVRSIYSSVVTRTATKNSGTRPRSTFTTKARSAAHSKKASARTALGASISTTTSPTETSATHIARGSVFGSTATEGSTSPVSCRKLTPTKRES